MKRNLNQIVNNEYDVVIIGAGMFGACAAWEAAQRGLSVALIDKGDFCQATSANHFKMVHGGIRYLQHADIYRVRESSRERSVFLRIAPHFVKPLPIVVPTFGHGIKGKEFLGAGMLLYDLLTIDRNFHISDPQRKIPSCRFISANELLDQFPGMERKNLTGAAIFCDAQIYNPTRLALSFIKSAIESGCDAANYLECISLLRNENTVYGVKARDVLGREILEIRGKVVLNTSGAWADYLIEKSLNKVLKPKPVFSRDTAFVVSKKLNSNYALAVTSKTKDVGAIIDRGGRHLFIVPWLDREFTLIGVWHLVWDEKKDRIYVTEEELLEFINEINQAYPALALTMDDVTMINAGLTLFGEGQAGSKIMNFGKRSILVDHSQLHSINGLITLIGVRATTARDMAEKAITLIAKKIGKEVANSETEKTPIYGGDIDTFDKFLYRATEVQTDTITKKVMVSLIHNHGSEYQAVLNYAKTNPDLAQTLPNTNVLKAEIIHAIKEEMAQKLSDVVFRRTDLGTAGNPGGEAVVECANLMGSALNWSESRIRSEVKTVKDFFADRGAKKSYHTQEEHKTDFHFEIEKH